MSLATAVFLSLLACGEAETGEADGAIVSPADAAATGAASDVLVPAAAGIDAQVSGTVSGQPYPAAWLAPDEQPAEVVPPPADEEGGQR